MAAIKLHLESEELSAVSRVADFLKITPEELAYAALDRLMLQVNDAAVREEIRQTQAWRSRALARWSDSARSVHIYESKPDHEQTPSKYLKIQEW